ncbi:TetR/AcrR family transcriptional regulator [Rhodococcus sp. BP-149]|uniref:TetR/AcrR family transcriptional regulator n=1 Tax=unclassified Rhodococcus (in: high G+C Gram-positive bacteria) TaxID=192944 RepID=UPI001C9B5C26|nr:MULTISPECIES: TetR/AcrR family transcriptional regulator [unclassified Rhodococcus (in: high G+C Gram-positive bacteria)]MBY6684698.1 TetR/AcrR family transcriptional regulator [Rhodococcus sp. BP-288]MBY6692818.1 TetR/AcrR family transcriptional regulator [Rhodococcus sp. BP-188]MBY6698716.1 TetR/AcrR family transcriptional regulator [Rhodococcus sp. BP-285]MBY6701395.1 TetR/AcrR family transcriptional regulator [Rhodococcus sp. BP-283]MBY6712396.1 TetR/AcrR family transcriptional regulato
MRRTQEERRTDTIARLLDATIASLCEKGYAATTVNEVVTRAEVSSGALFRHFATRLDLVVAAADEVRRRQFEEFRAGLSGFGSASVEHCLTLLRAACRAPINGAWYELLIAARSDDALRERLVPFTVRYHQEITDLGRSLPIAGTIPAAELDTVLFTVVHLLDGEALSAVVHPQPEQDEVRLHLVARLLRGESLYRRSEAG